jgi:hypothetical protein
MDRCPTDLDLIFFGIVADHDLKENAPCSPNTAT